MTRPLPFCRLAVALAPFAAMFAASCGGSDIIPEEDGGADSGVVTIDGAPIDANGSDGTVDGPAEDGMAGDTGTDASGMDGALLDADHDAADADAGENAPDAADASDARAEDASDAHAEDAADAADASDASDGDIEDASPGSDLLGSSAQFAVFSGATVTNANATTITGDLGTYPGNTAIGTTAPVFVSGTEHLGDGVAKAAASDIQIAYDALIPGNLPCGTDLSTPGTLGGRTLLPGVYCFSSTADLTGTLTLDAHNEPGAVWVFQIGSALTTASVSNVVLINGTAGQVCNAYWQIGSSATLGTNSVFGGNILAQIAVTLTTGTTLAGRAFGMSAGVTMDTNVVTIGGCAVSVPLLDAGLPLDAGLLDAGSLDAAKD